MSNTTSSSSAAVHRVHPVAIAVSMFLALLFQSYLPVKLPLARLMDLPLLITLYFSMLRRHKVFGIGLGTGMGLAQDLLAHGPLGVFGMVKALAGYLAAGSSFKFDLEQMPTRFSVVGVLVLVHNVCYFLLQRLLESQAQYPPEFRPLDLTSAVLVNVALALPIFLLLDHFRRPV